MLTIFSHMTALAQQHGAINLAQGFPDFPIDASLEGLVSRAIRDGYNQYAPMAGLPALRQALAADWQQRHGVPVDPDAEVTITPGATYGLFTAFQTLVRPGDEVLLLEPAYDSYVPAIRQAGGIPVPVALQGPGFWPDAGAIRAAMTPRTRCIVVNTPHNPTGAVWSAADWDDLAAVLDDRPDVAVVSDEVYEQLVYDGRPHRSVLHDERLRPRSFALFSFGKSLHTTGWKMGYAVAPPALTDRFRAIHQYLAFSVNAPMQKALADYLSSGLAAAAAPSAMLERKRDLFLQLLAETPFVPLAPAAGSYFQLASYAGLSALPERAFAEWLTRTHGVAAIPVAAFYSDGTNQQLLRFCFAKEEETLQRAAAALRTVPASGIPA